MCQVSSISLDRDDSFSVSALSERFLTSPLARLTKSPEKGMYEHLSCGENSDWSLPVFICSIVNSAQDTNLQEAGIHSSPCSQNYLSWVQQVLSGFPRHAQLSSAWCVNLYVSSIAFVQTELVLSTEYSHFSHFACALNHRVSLAVHSV